MTTGRTPPGSATPHTPVRTCVGCRSKDVQPALLRVVAEQGVDGIAVLVPDPRRLRPGRGAWLHPRSECFSLALSRRAFARALRLRSPVQDMRLREWLEASQ